MAWHPKSISSADNLAHQLNDNNAISVYIMTCRHDRTKILMAIPIFLGSGFFLWFLSYFIGLQKRFCPSVPPSDLDTMTFTDLEAIASSGSNQSVMCTIR